MPGQLLSFAAALGFGIWCGSFCTADSLKFLYIGLAGLFGISCWSVYRQKRVWILIVLFFIVGLIRCIEAEVLPANDISRFAGQNIKIRGQIVDVPEITSMDEQQQKVKYTLQISGGEGFSVSGGVIVYQRQAVMEELPRCGDEVLVVGKVDVPHGYNNPGLPDTVKSLARQGITARMSVAPGGMAAVNHADSWSTHIAVWRKHVFQDMQKVMPQSDAGILNGFIFGGYTGIKSEIVKAYAATGIIHILSVSGTHIALVGGILTWLGTTIGLRRYTGILACAGVLFYAVISGLSPPVVRSAIMGMLAFLAIWAGREKDSPTAFALAVIGMLSYEPSLIFDISFQLSFGATAGLLFLYPKLYHHIKLPKFIGGALAVTIAAQLGVLPFIAWYFSSLSLSSLIANMIVVPIVEFVVVMGLAGVMLGTVMYFAGQAVFVLCSLILGIVNSMVLLLAELPGGYITIPSGNLYSGLIYYVVLAWIFGFLPKKMLQPQQIIARWPRQSMLALGGMFICLTVYCLWPQPVYVHFIDVGQGDATLITTPHRHALLIDAGGSMGSSNFDVGERVVVPYLKHYGIKKLDYLILTHGHQDHAGGAAGVANNLTVKNILLSRETFTGSVENLIRVHPAGIVPVYEGQSIMLDGVKLVAVHAISPHKATPGNEVSCVFRVEYRQRSFLVTGDLDADGEEEMLAKPLGRVDVLKVGHHGSKSSSTARFLQALSPEYAIISVGYNNRFGHPHAETLKRLSQCNIKVLRTDQQGAIIAQTDGVQLTIDSYK